MARPPHNVALARARLFAPIAFMIFIFLFLLRPTHTRQHAWQLTSNAYNFFSFSKPPPFQHPIPGLIEEARNKFKNMMSKQSRTLGDAVKEYRSRYGRDPPKGFDKWWKFTQQNSIKVIDEYDSLMKDLEPFWVLPPAELRRRIRQVGTLPSVDLVRVQDGKVDVVKGLYDEPSARAIGFSSMVKKFEDVLPDMEFSINSKSEGRVLVPWHFIKFPNSTRQDSTDGFASMIGEEFIVDWRGRSNVWEAFRRTCDPQSQSRRLLNSLRAHFNETDSVNHFESAPNLALDQSFHFAESTNANFDFCAHPWAKNAQGHFFSDWTTISALYPVFSPAKAPGYSDILIPSHYYYSPTSRYTYGFDRLTFTIKDVDDHEVPWEQKSNTVFWRGATTGGGSSPPGFLPQYQRHRFVRMASDSSDINRTVVFANPPETNHYVRAKVPVGALNEDFMDVAFTKAVGCANYPTGCEGMQRDHRFAEAVQLGEHWRHKYLVDIDGMGYSARFFAFLASESAVIKSTVYREFYSDWIQPWLHFIPLSTTYSELYNIYAYFSGASPSMQEAIPSATNLTSTKPSRHNADEELHRIARAGRNWKAAVGRRVDMESYVYRLCLEWARLVADDREAMSFKF